MSTDDRGESRVAGKDDLQRAVQDYLREAYTDIA